MADMMEKDMTKSDMAASSKSVASSEATAEGGGNKPASRPEASAETSGISLENTALFAKWRKYQAKKQESAAQRRHTRHECSALGVMSIANRSITMEGIVTEVSQGGVKFRPATTYLLHRNGTQVSVTFSTIRVTGKIVATRPDGYGIALFEELDDELIQEFLRLQTEMEDA